MLPSISDSLQLRAYLVSNKCSCTIERTSIYLVMYSLSHYITMHLEFNSEDDPWAAALAEAQEENKKIAGSEDSGEEEIPTKTEAKADKKKDKKKKGKEGKYLWCA